MTVAATACAVVVLVATAVGIIALMRDAFRKDRR